MGLAKRLALRPGDEGLHAGPPRLDLVEALGLGVIDVKTQEVEPPTLVADRIRRALEIVPAERLVINPDCGCVHLSREAAFSKLSAMVEGTRIVRKELGQ